MAQGKAQTDGVRRNRVNLKGDTMKRIALLILAAVVIVGVMLTLNSDASAGKRKGKKTPNAGGIGAVTQMADSRYS